MAKLTYVELTEKIKNYIGERDDDASIEILEDVADTLTGEPEDWKEKYDALDAEWRARYKARFYDAVEEKEEEKDEEEKTEVKIEDVLKEE